MHKRPRAVRKVCKHGHDFTDPDNVYLTPSGKRYCRACKHDKRRESKHGLSVNDISTMLDGQDGRCAICKRVFRDETPCIDHDHRCCPGRKSCGKCVRGLLCSNCNSGIGMLGDSIDTLSCAIAYLAASNQAVH
jgi:hypothetical protein